jgi:hypothetical protein
MGMTNRVSCDEDYYSVPRKYEGPGGYDLTIQEALWLQSILDPTLVDLDRLDYDNYSTILIERGFSVFVNDQAYGHYQITFKGLWVLFLYNNKI